MHTYTVDSKNRGNQTLVKHKSTSHVRQMTQTNVYMYSEFQGLPRSLGRMCLIILIRDKIKLHYQVQCSNILYHTNPFTSVRIHMYVVL